MATNKIKARALDLEREFKVATPEDFLRTVLADVGLGYEVDLEQYHQENIDKVLPGDIVYKYRGTMRDAIYGICLDEKQVIIGWARKVTKFIYPQRVMLSSLQGWQKLYRIPAGDIKGAKAK